MRIAWRENHAIKIEGLENRYCDDWGRCDGAPPAIGPALGDRQAKPPNCWHSRQAVFKCNELSALEEKHQGKCRIRFAVSAFLVLDKLQPLGAGETYKQ